MLTKRTVLTHCYIIISLSVLVNGEENNLFLPFRPGMPPQLLWPHLMPPNRFIFPQPPNLGTPTPPDTLPITQGPTLITTTPLLDDGPSEVVLTTASKQDDRLPEISIDPVLWLSVVDTSSMVQRIDVKFQGETFLEFHQCLSQPDNVQCNVAITQGVVSGTEAIKVWAPSAPTDSYTCSAAVGAQVICKREEEPGDDTTPAFRVFHKDRTVDIYWDDQQTVDVFLQRNRVGTLLECTGKCWYYGDDGEDDRRDDRRDDHGIVPTGIALIIVCVVMFILAVVLIAIFIVKTKKLAWFKPSPSHTKPNLANIENAEKANRIDKFKLPPINSVYATTGRYGEPDVVRHNPLAPEKRRDAIREDMENIPLDNPPAYPLLVWPMETRFKDPAPGSDPPPYYTLVQSRPGSGKYKGKDTSDERRRSSLVMTQDTLTNVAV